MNSALRASRSCRAAAALDVGQLAGGAPNNWAGVGRFVIEDRRIVELGPAADPALLPQFELVLIGE